MIKICEECGKQFETRTGRQRFCKGPHYNICAICGKEFEYSCIPTDKPNTCSKTCRKLYRKRCLQEKYGVDNVSQIAEVREKKKVSNASVEAQTKTKQTNLEKYGVPYACQSLEVRSKISSALRSEEVKTKRAKTFQEHYGVDHIFKLPSYRQQYGCNVVSTLDSTKQSIKRTLLEKYGVDNAANIPGVAAKSQILREQTCLQKYGENCIFKTQYFKEKMLSDYGVENVMKNAEILQKANRNKQHKSNLEIRLHNILTAYDIKYIEEYAITEHTLAHSFDIYLPKYKILIDCDGDYWHSYTEDPDGGRIRDDGDEVRLALVPNDHIFYLIVESDFERGLRGLLKMIKELDANVFDYDSELFTWCRRNGFPYYHYDDERLFKEWHRLSNYDFFEYNENRRFGLSIINHFHRSIFDCRTKGSISPREAWEDDNLLKKVIANRLIYQNVVDPSKVLKGFNISKLATKVSVFNPTLAGYICNKYLKNYDVICDPFSGFSGRLLGVTATGRTYIGSDLNEVVVNESNMLIDHMKLNCEHIKVQDVLSDNMYSYPALLTCPPYADKEVYNSETTFNTCDNWIDIVLSKYDCKRYVFVVDHTYKYVDNIVEELKSRSHFRRSSEYIVIVDK